MGVLQRIALAYGIAAFLCMTIRRDYLWIVTAFLLLLYWLLLAFLGGDNPYSLEGNLALKVDRAILGANHLYKGFGIPFDPEGLLSTITSVCTVIIGFYTGGLIGKGRAEGKNVIKLVLIGAAVTGMGLLWSLTFPINKPLWTSSYVLFTAGIAMIIFAIVYMIADVLKFSIWGIFFVIFGTNALISYFMAGIWTKLMLFVKVPSGDETVTLYSWFYENICVPVAGNMNGSLMFALIQMTLVWVIASILYRKKVMIRL